MNAATNRLTAARTRTILAAAGISTGNVSLTETLGHMQVNVDVLDFHGKGLVRRDKAATVALGKRIDAALRADGYALNWTLASCAAGLKGCI